MIVDIIRLNQLDEASAHARGEGIPTSLQWREARLLAEMEMLGTELAHSPISPSAIGGLTSDRKCTRQHLYRLLDFPRLPVGARTFDAFRDGHYHEAAVIADIETYSPYKIHSRQMRVETGDGQWGYIDGIAVDPLGKEYLLEVKSITGNGFNNMLGIAQHGESYDLVMRWTDDGWVWDNDAHPLEGHVVQVHRLLDGLRGIAPQINQAIIIYRSKNTSSLAEFIIDYNPEFAQAASARVAEISELAKARQLPPREYRLPTATDEGDWQCGYCAYRHHCAEGLPVVQAPPNPPELPEAEAELARQMLAAKSEMKKAEKVANERLKDAKVKVLQNLGQKTFMLDGRKYEIGTTTIKEAK